jgi:hypothetical protein
MASKKKRALDNNTQLKGRLTLDCGKQEQGSPWDAHINARRKMQASSVMRIYWSMK